MPGLCVHSIAAACVQFAHDVCTLCCTQVIRNEGVKSLFKGAGANILRAVAGAGVLSGYDQLQVRVGQQRMVALSVCVLHPSLFLSA